MRTKPKRIFLDIAFPAQKTCGLAIGDTDVWCVDFAEGQKRIIEHLAGAKQQMPRPMFSSTESCCGRSHYKLLHVCERIANGRLSWVQVGEIHVSPTYFAVHMTDAEKRLQRARAVDDIRAMQRALAEMTALYQAYYGAPTATH